MHLTPLQQISKIYDPFNFFDFIYHSYNTGQKHYPPTPIAIYIQEGMQFVSLYFDSTDIIFWFGKLMHSEILAIFSLFKTSFCKNIMKNI
jgi:hypothetical protein